MKHARLYSDLLPVLKERAFEDSGFSAEGTFISVSAVPQTVGPFEMSEPDRLNHYTDTFSLP